MHARRKFRILLLVCLFVLAFGACNTIGSFLNPQPEFPNPDEYTWIRIAENVFQPVLVTHAGDGSGRIFIADKSGVILIMLDGEFLPDPFLYIRENIKIIGYEQGLLGIAFHPNYAENGYFYVHYTDTQGHSKVVRYTASRENPNVADPKSRKVILYVEQPWKNHNGGNLVFGPDGFLYIGLGFGRHDPDPEGNAQSPDILLGKILRIDVDNGNPYAIPEDNPFSDGGGLPEIWALGLRNPWRFSFDPENGNLFIGDVGADSREEINFLPADFEGIANFGWNFNEGNLSIGDSPPSGTILQSPIIEYTHGDGKGRCAIIGGVVYRGDAMPDWEGVYLYGDYCSGEIMGLIPGEGGNWESQVLYESNVQITSFGIDEEGEIYVLDYKGRVFQLVVQDETD